LHLHLPFHLLQLLRLVGLSPHHIELAAAALALGVHVVAQTCGAQRTTLVEILRIDHLGRKGIARATRAQHLALRCPLAVGVAALDHKVFDDPMEQRAVVKSLLHQFDEVVAVLGVTS
jgi:hypothetical protein